MGKLKYTAQEYLNHIISITGEKWELCDLSVFLGTGKPFILSCPLCNAIVTKQEAKKFLVSGCQCQIVRKRKETCLKKYGYESPLLNQEIRAKLIAKHLEKYGVEYPMQRKEVKDKSISTCLDKYGSKYANQNETVKKKIVKTCLEKYGTTNGGGSKEAQIKIEKSSLERYGVKRPSQDSNIRLKIREGHIKYYDDFQKLFHSRDTLKEGLILLNEKLGHMPTITEVMIASGYSTKKYLYEYGISKYSNLYKQSTSVAEEIIADFLTENDIDFEEQYYFEDLVSSKQHYLRFDFAIFENGELKFLIEYDGEQHYKYVKLFHGDLSGFKYQQQRDNLKNLYCEKNNIHLLRLPYWLNNAEIKEEIKANLK